MLTARHLFLSLGSPAKQVLNDISLEIAPGTCAMLLGPNGAGKSTLLHVLSGGSSGFEGDVFYDGQALRSITSEALAQQRAVLMQHNHVPFPYRVAEIVMMARHPFHARSTQEEDTAICEQAMHAADVYTLRDRVFFTLSGGEQQRVMLARAMAQLWKVPHGYLFLDEPTSALDMQHQKMLLGYMKEYAAGGGTVLCIVHDINLAAAYADMIILMRQGGIIAQGAPSCVFTEDSIRDVFSVEATITQQPTARHTTVQWY